jgi:hyperosmotically inducible protein
MESTRFSRTFLLGSALVLAGSMFMAGCNNKASHPDEKSAVTNSLNGNNLSAVNVSQDRDKGVITLSGDVDSADAKDHAESLAKQAAPDYTIQSRQRHRRQLQG